MRGGCPYLTKVQHAQEAAAAAVVVMNTEPGLRRISAAGTPAAARSRLTIPTVMVTSRAARDIRRRLLSDADGGASDTGSAGDGVHGSDNREATVVKTGEGGHTKLHFEPLPATAGDWNELTNLLAYKQWLVLGVVPATRPPALLPPHARARTHPPTHAHAHARNSRAAAVAGCLWPRWQSDTRVPAHAQRLLSVYSHHL